MEAIDYIEEAERIALDIEKSVDSILANLDELNGVKDAIKRRGKSFTDKVEQLESQSEILNRVGEKLEFLTD